MGQSLDGDGGILWLWKWVCRVTMDGKEKVLQTIGVYEPMMFGTVDEKDVTVSEH